MPKAPDDHATPLMVAWVQRTRAGPKGVAASKKLAKLGALHPTDCAPSLMLHYDANTCLGAKGLKKKALVAYEQELAALEAPLLAEYEAAAEAALAHSGRTGVVEFLKALQLDQHHVLDGFHTLPEALIGTQRVLPRPTLEQGGVPGVGCDRPSDLSLLLEAFKVSRINPRLLEDAIWYRRANLVGASAAHAASAAADAANVAASAAAAASASVASTATAQAGQAEEKKGGEPASPASPATPPTPWSPEAPMSMARLVIASIRRRTRDLQRSPPLLRWLRRRLIAGTSGIAGIGSGHRRPSLTRTPRQRGAAQR